MVPGNLDLIDKLESDHPSSSLAGRPDSGRVRGHHCRLPQSHRSPIGVLKRSVRRSKLTVADRLFWACLSRYWADWRTALVIVKPETVIAWHRRGFRLFWTWRARHGRPGRPPVSAEVRQLIRRLSRENSVWGAPRIHGELLKLGIDIGETTVGKYSFTPGCSNTSGGIRRQQPGGSSPLRQAVDGW